MNARCFHQMNSGSFPPRGVFMSGVLMHSARQAAAGPTHQRRIFP